MQLIFTSDVSMSPPTTVDGGRILAGIRLDGKTNTQTAATCRQVLGSRLTSDVAEMPRGSRFLPPNRCRTSDDDRSETADFSGGLKLTISHPLIACCECSWRPQLRRARASAPSSIPTIPLHAAPVSTSLPSATHRQLESTPSKKGAIYDTHLLRPVPQSPRVTAL